MRYLVRCPCGKRYRVGKDVLGKRAKCEACGATFLAQAEETPEPSDPQEHLPTPAPAVDVTGEASLAERGRSAATRAAPEAPNSDKHDEVPGTRPSLATRIILIVVLLAFLVTTPGFVRYWYLQGMGRAVLNEWRVRRPVGPDDVIEGQLAQIRATARPEGVKLALLMLAGQHVPVYLLILITVGILARSTSAKFKRCLIISYAPVCLAGLLWLSFGLAKYGVVASSFREAFGPALIIWIAIAASFGFIIGLVKVLRRFRKRPADKEGEDKRIHTEFARR